MVGSRFFGAAVLQALLQEQGIEFTRIVAPAEDDRLAIAARAAGLDLHVLQNPKVVPGDAIPEGTELIVAAHTHARVSAEALQRARIGAVGYHPSLLPRHRGIAAVEWTILEGDPIAGGTVYHLASGWDDGAIAAQDWCFVVKGETARELWERALAPIGLKLLAQVARHASDHGALPARPQDERFATKAPMLKRAVLLKEDGAAAMASLVVTVMGVDRPGIVGQIAERAQRFGANWAASKISNLAGEFAGMVQLEVPHEQVDALTIALRDLESASLRVMVAPGQATEPSVRSVELQLVGDDRLGIVSGVTRILADRGVSIDRMQTEIARGPTAAKPTFKVVAQLRVPPGLSVEALRQPLESLANEMMLDIALGERTLAGDAP